MVRCGLILLALAVAALAGIAQNEGVVDVWPLPLEKRQSLTSSASTTCPVTSSIITRGTAIITQIITLPCVTTMHPNITTAHPNVTTVHPNVTTSKATITSTGNATITSAGNATFHSTTFHVITITSGSLTTEKTVPVVTAATMTSPSIFSGAASPNAKPAAGFLAAVLGAMALM